MEPNFTDPQQDQEQPARLHSTTPSEIRRSNSPLKWVITALIVLVVLGLVWFVWVWVGLGNDAASNNSKQTNTSSVAATFQECVDQGNPVQESYPERCTTTDGQTFTNPNQQLPSTDTADQTPAIITLTGNDIIVIAKREDLSKLKDIAPASFTDFMAGALSLNTPTDENCITAYSISIISSINVAGAAGPVNATSGEPEDKCVQGGARMVWYQQDGVWNSIGMQSIVDCSFVVDAKIYQEFIETCYEETAEDQIAPNPNGSVQQAI